MRHDPQKITEIHAMSLFNETPVIDNILNHITRDNFSNTKIQHYLSPKARFRCTNINYLTRRGQACLRYLMFGGILKLKMKFWYGFDQLRAMYIAY